MYKYETHCHTLPVSRCAKASVADTVRFYREAGYDGLFITNHFLDGNINIDRNAPYEEKIRFYFSDFHEAETIGKEIGIKVFPGVEQTYAGTDFLIYGLDEDWYLIHPEIIKMDERTKLGFFREAGALVIHAHPFREDSYIDHIRLYPRSVDGIEIINAGRKEIENLMAEHYAREYGFLVTAGTDNHRAGSAPKLAGMASDAPVNSVEDFIRMVREGSMSLFVENRG